MLFPFLYYFILLHEPNIHFKGQIRVGKENVTTVSTKIDLTLSLIIDCPLSFKNCPKHSTTRHRFTM